MWASCKVTLHRAYRNAEPCPSLLLQVQASGATSHREKALECHLFHRKLRTNVVTSVWRRIMHKFRTVFCKRNVTWRPSLSSRKAAGKVVREMQEGHDNTWHRFDCGHTHAGFARKSQGIPDYAKELRRLVTRRRCCKAWAVPPRCDPVLWPSPSLPHCCLQPQTFLVVPQQAGDVPHLSFSPPSRGPASQQEPQRVRKRDYFRAPVVLHPKKCQSASYAGCDCQRDVTARICLFLHVVFCLFFFSLFLSRCRESRAPTCGRVHPPMLNLCTATMARISSWEAFFCNLLCVDSLDRHAFSKMQSFALFKSHLGRSEVIKWTSVYTKFSLNVSSCCAVLHSIVNVCNALLPQTQC